MKRRIICILPLTLIGGLISSGCISTHRTEVLPPTGRTVVTSEPVTTTTTRTVVVSPSPPPAPKTEIIGAPPTETDAWVSGYWNYNDGNWVWMPGHWEARPRTSAVWIPGHWDQTPDGNYAWTPGYWD